MGLTSELVPQMVANGLIAGAMYALVAAGFSLLYSTNRFIHFAHGAVITAAAFALYMVLVAHGAPFPVAVMAAAGVAVAVGWLCFALVYAPLKRRGASSSVLLLASIGLLILVENLLVVIFGPDVKVINYFPVHEGVAIGGARVTPLQLAMIGVALALMILLYFFLFKNKYGKTMRAVANNAELAATIGIPVVKFQHLSFVAGSLLAGAAGVLIALERSAEAGMGTALMIKGFAGAVVGGIHSVVGGIIGSFVVGLAENAGVLVLPSAYKDAIAFVLLFIFLIWKPEGIMGVKKGTREE